MIKHGREYRQQYHVNVVETSSTSSDGSFDVTEAADFQVGEGLIQVISSMCEEWQ